MAVMRPLADLAVHRWRLIAATMGGALLGWAASGRLPTGSAILLGWVVFAAIFVATTVRMFLTTDESVVRRHARLEDENKGILTSLILGAVAASVAVALLALRDSKLITGRHIEGGQWWVLGLSILTLVLSWLLAQCLFVLHYAHRYFGDADADGTEDGGIKFPGEAPKTYRDFIYVAVCVGATCQVSDFNITTCRFRNLVTAHALFSFAFNTMILALGINILAGMLAQ
jgi:uncharacterized membrane protein